MSRAVLRSTQAPGITYFKIGPKSWDAFQRVAATALKTSPGVALKEIYTKASPAKKVGIVVGGGLIVVGLVSLACGSLLEADKRLTPTNSEDDLVCSR